jgi:Exonuclease VII, large subunit
LKFNRILYSNSIKANLKKGYSVLTSKNKLLKNSTKTKKGELIKAHLEKGKIDLIVKKIN